ncbi:hypothetical protein PIB30_109430, partial [Stylosanthes scabra]|nr:hypothetical protein [Stylosanthes scabra]
EKRFKKKKAYISWENEEESESSDEDENANICLMAKDNEVRNGAKNLKFYVDSGCSKHMTGEPSNFVNIKPIDSPKTFSFLYKRAIPASGPDQVVSLYEWISFPRRSVDQTIFGLILLSRSK